MKNRSLLIIGGTRFVGRIVIEKLLKDEANYIITVFNRGITNKTLFQNEANINFIYGDRETNDIKQLFNKKWDVVIDFMAYYPDSIAFMLNKMHQNIGRYLFISTISVYDLENPTSIPINEKGKLLKWESKHRKDTTWESYGQRKIACEEEVQKIFNLDHIILRPSLIYGKYDYSERFYYWLNKMKNETAINIPEDFNKLVNYTFSEDFANVIIHFMEADHKNNVYNVVTHKATKLTDILNVSKKMLQSNCTLIPVKLEPSNAFKYPLWFPMECLEISSERLHNEFNLKFKTIEESLHLTVNYMKD